MAQFLPPNGGTPGLRSDYIIGGGGGRSAIYLVEESQETVLAIAGSGGGAGGTGWGDSQSISGGSGGEIGENGSFLSLSTGCEGIGGTQTESLEQVCEIDGITLYGPAGGYLFGGNGLNFDSLGNCGGGGGDGYYGGGAGALHAGGGGGSSYVDETLRQHHVRFINGWNNSTYRKSQILCTKHKLKEQLGITVVMVSLSFFIEMFLICLTL